MEKLISINEISISHCKATISHISAIFMVSHLATYVAMEETKSGLKAFSFDEIIAKSIFCQSQKGRRKMFNQLSIKALSKSG